MIYSLNSNFEHDSLSSFFFIMIAVHLLSRKDGMTLPELVDAFYFSECSFLSRNLWDWIVSISLSSNFLRVASERQFLVVVLLFMSFSPKNYLVHAEAEKKKKRSR